MSDSHIFVPSELFALAESSLFCGSLDFPRLVIGSDVYVFDTPITWEVTLSNTGEAFVVSGSVESRATTQCARCLDDFSLLLVGAVEGYIVHREGFTPKDLELDEFFILPDDHRIDLEPLLETALIMGAPRIPLCDVSCKGLCPTCGNNLNREPCVCADSVSSDDPFNPFAALRTLQVGEIP